MVASAEAKMTRMVTSFCSQFTGKLPTRTSRIVPPPIAVTKDIIRIPKRSNFFSMAENTPDTANANVPKMSITLRKLEYMQNKNGSLRSCLVVTLFYQNHANNVLIEIVHLNFSYEYFIPPSSL